MNLKTQTLAFAVKKENGVIQIGKSFMFSPQAEAVKFPLIGVICNWKGIKEENYLYTLEELRKYDPDLCERCLQSNKWEDSTLSSAANKTWGGYIIPDKESLSAFLRGYANITEAVLMEDNDLYGEKSNTMIIAKRQHERKIAL